MSAPERAAILHDGEFIIVSHEDAGRTSTGPSSESLMRISNYIDEISDELWEVNEYIHNNPELGYEEYKTHARLTSFMLSKKEWRVTKSAYGMDTAWVAVYDREGDGPVVSFNVEMDALPGMGHACGHNLIATASLAGALATAELMRQGSLGGKVVIFGTPAEEGGGGKIRLLKAGAYNDHGVQVSLISHPGISHDGAMVHTAAYARFKVEYFGREAHAGNSPWLGINALDALVVAYTALSVLRQQTMPGDIIQGHITDGGVAPNIIHAYAAGVFAIRANTMTRLQELQRKVGACFRAGAEATGARLEMTRLQVYADHVPNKVLAASYARCWNLLSPPSKIPVDPAVDLLRGQLSASTDQGDISHNMPSLNASFAIPPGLGGGGPHSPGFANASGTRKAFLRCLRTGKALAGTAVDILTEDGLLAAALEQWRRDMETSN